ncbi:MAG TPA: AI-2E family transporter [Chitinophagaceae bacterium]|jgi:predicted PurR-regulated permease PerM|nr:AI-2E family transporter [Chitinophagaceae bacterium]
MNAQKDQDTESAFVRKVWIVAGIAALVVAIFWLGIVTFNVLLLILAAVLIATYFRGLAGILHRNTRLGMKASLAISVIGSLLLLIGFLWFSGTSIQGQAQQLSKTLPSAIDNFRQKLSSSTVGQKLLEQASSGGGGKSSGMFQSFFRSTFGVLGDIYVVLFLGIFFTASPKTYVQGLVRLAPAPARARTDEVLHKVGDTLKKWLKGQLLAMLVVAVLTLIGLLIMGVPMALVLALIAGLLNFIPNIGPLIAMVPAVLIGLMQGTGVALGVAGLYIGVQMLESNLITPQIQKRMIEVPPALIISAQLFMGVLTGGWGLVLATPLLALLMTVVQELYIKKQEQQIKIQ